MYRFLLSPRWLAAAALAVAAAVVMVMLGNWQLRRYEERSAINDRIDAADSIAAVPLTSALIRPTAPGAAGAAPGKDLAWTKVTVSGRYDPSHEIQARGRTVDGEVGFEIVTPLVLTDGTAVLVDRGWVPAPPGGALAAPVVPPAPSGDVTVVGQVHLSESRPVAVERRDGRLDTRRISLSRLAPEMPYPVYGAYVLLTEQTPANDEAFTRIPIDHEDAWQNGGYAVQWWLFAAMALAAYVYYARKEAHGPEPAGDRSAAQPRTPRGGDRVDEADRRRDARGDRVEEADRRRDAPGDRVEEADRKRAAAAATQGDRVTDADRAREGSQSLD
ncbi:SURF1 family cytochrome oxidase biogenesis protein [Paractinoplanes maris]|uniref:SURF1 family cytochrome oxidase biogenesis protein n=1 Tax=Paractinoplanes maris TaxID=1734446 RepID=UPI0020206D9A|nr:SURF1 family protein [Actinoplanes maris]